MHFAQPLWIISGILLCLALLIYLRFLEEKRAATLDKFVSIHLRTQLTQNVSNSRRTLKKIFLILAIFTCFIALARPQYGFKWVEVKRKGIDILFALDTSKSMLAEDIKPNRLERAKFAILDFVNQLEGDRVGLLPFAGSSFLMCPMTIDYQAFEQSLDAVDSKIIPKGGTDIASAIEGAETVLKNEANHKVLVLITDGENLQGEALAAAEEAAKNGMRIFTVGVGTQNGELVPLSINGKTTFVKDETGKFITSRLDEEMLTKIAEASDGIYAPLGNRGEGLETIYQKKLSLIPKQELGERRHKVPLERFEWAVAVAITLFIIEFLLGGRKAKPFQLPTFLQRRLLRRQKPTALVLLLLLISQVLPNNSQASVGETAYEAGDYLSASEYYSSALEKDPDNLTLHYNYGATAYKNNLYDDAITSFSTALKSNDVILQERAYYNRGNAHYQKGKESRQADPQLTIKQWEEALNSYQASLALQPDAKDAQFNHDLVKRNLEELKKQQEEQEKDNQGQEGDQKEKNQDQKNKDPQKSPPQDNQDNSPQQESKKQNEKDSPADPSPSQTEEGKNAAPSQQGDAKRQEDAANAERRKLGKMTKEEAEQLLNGLKNEEGNLNFVPAKNFKDNDTPRRDW